MKQSQNHTPRPTSDRSSLAREDFVRWGSMGGKKRIESLRAKMSPEELKDLNAENARKSLAARKRNRLVNKPTPDHSGQAL